MTQAGPINRCESERSGAGIARAFTAGRRFRDGRYMDRQRLNPSHNYDGRRSDHDTGPARSIPAQNENLIWESQNAGRRMHGQSVCERSWGTKHPGIIRCPEGTRCPGGNEASRKARSFQRTRASANTSGPDLTAGFGPGEIADLENRTERRKLVSSAGPSWKERTLSKYDPAV